MASRIGVSKLGSLGAKNSALFLCDMQEKFRQTIKYFNEIVSVSNRLLRASKILEIPVVVTEQYPKGLGPTVKELGIQDYEIKPFPKTVFSMCLPEVEESLKKLNPDINTIILCGVETHACIQQTTLQYLEKGYNVHVVVDACSSRSLVDRMYAFNRLQQCGAFLSTSEGIILELLKGSHHPRFKEVQKIIMESAPDSGLLEHKL